MNIAGECKDCGFVYDPTLYWTCPACRAKRVAEMFKPIDPLRTAVGAGYEYMRGKKYAEPAPIPPRFSDGESTEVPRGCKLPKYEDDQIYELRRMFRL